jgi:hypothetical protein
MRAMTIAAMLLTSPLAAAPMAFSSAAATPPAQAWEIGPIIRGRNYSVGMPLSPTPARTGWYFDFPNPAASSGHVHYLTFRHGSLAGKRRIVMRYRIDAPRGTRFVPQQSPQNTALLSLYFQRRGDNWSGRGRYDPYRWYAPMHTAVPLTPGEHVVTARLDDLWTGVNVTTAATDPEAFREALEDADRVGFVLGSVAGRGHGVYATKPARFTVISFEVI